MSGVSLLQDRNTNPAKCTQCQAELASPIVCDGCHTLFPASTTRDHFELLGMPHSYTIDEARLNASYRAIVRSVHPDRFDSDSADVMSLSVRLSAALNQAYEILRDPIRRADYLLERSGGPSAIEVRDVPGTLLAEILGLREEVEEAQASNDPIALDKLRISLLERRAQTLDQIRGLASSLPNTDEQSRKELRTLLNSMKYFDNLLAELAPNPLAGAECSSHD